MADPLAKVRAAEAVRLARSGMSLSSAARESGTTVATVRRYFAKSVRRHNGRLRVAATDEVPFTMRVASTDGIVQVAVASSVDRSIVGAHFNAIDRFLSTGVANVLDPFVGVRVGGVELETDPDQLIAGWRAGIHDDLDIYNLDSHTP